MSNELIEKKDNELVATISQQGLGEMLKPLIREIHLFDSYVAGTTHLEDKSVLEEINIGDKLNLLRVSAKQSPVGLKGTPAANRSWGAGQMMLSFRCREACIRGCHGSSSSSSALDGFFPRYGNRDNTRSRYA